MEFNFKTNSIGYRFYISFVNKCNGRLDLPHNDIRYVEYAAQENADCTQKGCVMIEIIPNYSGAPADLQPFFTIKDEIKYILKKGTAWYYWNGVDWVESHGTYSQANTTDEIDANKNSFTQNALLTGWG